MNHASENPQADIVYQVLHNRRSVRTYTDQPLSEEAIDRIVDAALAAPSAFNAQAREVVCVRDPGVKDALYRASGQQQFAEAAALFVLVGLSTPEDVDSYLGEVRAQRYRAIMAGMPEQKRRESAFRDAALAGMNLMIAAQAEGIATNPTSGWDEQAVKAALGIAEDSNRHIVVIIAAGYSDLTPPQPARASARRIENSYRSDS